MIYYLSIIILLLLFWCENDNSPPGYESVTYVYVCILMCPAVILRCLCHRWLTYCRSKAQAQYSCERTNIQHHYRIDLSHHIMYSGTSTTYTHRWFAHASPVIKKTCNDPLNHVLSIWNTMLVWANEHVTSLVYRPIGLHNLYRHTDHTPLVCKRKSRHRVCPKIRCMYQRHFEAPLWIEARTLAIS